MPRFLFVLPLILFLGLAVYFGIGLTKDSRMLPSALIDQPAPAFDLPPLLSDLPGLATSDFGGEVKLVNFFASWCIPCRAEHPILMFITEQKMVPLYGINYKNKVKDATDWLEELGNPYQRIGRDESGRAGIEWGVYGLPETYIIDKQGRIRYRHVGPLFPEDLKETIMPLVEALRK